MAGVQLPLEKDPSETAVQDLMKKYVPLLLSTLHKRRLCLAHIRYMSYLIPYTDARAHTHMHAHMYVCVHMNTCVFTYKHVCVCVCVCV
jgi:hypothetical protein